MPCPYARHGSASPSVPHALGRELAQTLPLFRIESFGVLLHSGCLVRSLGALRTCTETLAAFVAFCGCESDVLAPHIVFRPVRVNSHVRPLGSRSLCGAFSASVTKRSSLDSSAEVNRVSETRRPRSSAPLMRPSTFDRPDPPLSRCLSPTPPGVLARRLCGSSSSDKMSDSTLQTRQLIGAAPPVGSLRR